MPRKRNFMRRLAHKDSADRHNFDTEDILRGLSPRLVIDLARLAGASREDLSVTLHLMSYGDRAVMVAYGLIELSPAGESGERSLQVDPSCLEVIAAAAELVASVVDPAAVAARLQRAVEDGHAVEPYVPVATVEEQRGGGTEAFGGVVRSTAPAGDGLVRLDVDLDPQVGRRWQNECDQSGRVVVVTRDEPSFKDDARVSLAYLINEKPLSIAVSEEPVPEPLP